MRVLLLAVFSLFMTAPALSAPEPPSITEIRTALHRFNADAAFPLPILTDENLANLRKGELVRIIDHPDQNPNAPKRATGLMLIPQNRDLLWLACQDADYALTTGVLEREIGGTYEKGILWYGYLKLPAPFKARQWVVSVHDNLQLAERSSGEAWEHYWRNIETPASAARPFVAKGDMKGLPMTDFEAGIWTPDNSGAWVAIKFGEDQTLFGYHAQTTLGGNIPSSLILAWAKAGLDDVLQGVIDRTAGVPGHYTGDHPPRVGGDGREIPRW